MRCLLEAYRHILPDSLRKKLHLRRRIYEFFGSSRFSRPSLFEIDRKLEKYLSFKNGFFVEVGANDGYSQSNTYYLEKFLGWRGVLVEGIPELYEICRKERKNSHVINCALVSKDYRLPFVKMHYANLMSVVQGSLKSEESQENHIKSSMQVQNLKQSYIIEVQARTLESVLDKINDLPKIDFFSLDVEGYELEVLKGLNIQKYRPEFILVEARFFDEVHSFLVNYYDLVEQLTEHDYLYNVK